MFKEFQPTTGPKRWFFIDPDTGRELFASTKKELMERVVTYRKQNSLIPLSALSNVIDNFLCSQPENIGACQEVKLNRGWTQYFKGGIALLQNLFFGDENMVSQEEADRRAAICVECPLNKQPYKTNTETWSDQIAELCTNGRKSTLHTSLFNCMACSCLLKAKVFYKGDFNLTDKQRARIENENPKCWQIEKGK